MVTLVTNHKAETLSQADGVTCACHFSPEDSDPLRVTELKGSGHVAALNSPRWYGYGSSPDLKWPKAKFSQLVPDLNILCVLGQVPLPGPLSLGCRDPLGPVQAEILWLGQCLDPTHSEWPQTGAWQGGLHPVLCHPPNWCLDLEQYFKSHP